MNQTLQVIERGFTVLGVEDLRRLEDAAAFRSLIDQGIASITRTRGEYRLAAGPYVGHAVVGNAVIQVNEKIPGALDAFLGLADSPAVREASAESIPYDSTYFLVPMIDRFMAAVDAYLASGRFKEYVRQRLSGPIAKGKIDVAASMRMWVLGRGTHVAYRQWELSPRVAFNQAVGSALHYADYFLPYGETARRRKLRTRGILFDDSDWQTFARQSKRVLQNAFDHLAESYPEYTLLISLARVLVLHCGMSSARADDEVPYSWFVNLETLFEECARKALAAEAPVGGLRVSDWRVSERYMFAAENAYRTEPDIVVWSNDTPIAICDVKYKDIDTHRPENNDLYQLDVHAQAWNVRKAFLLYPATTNRYRVVGESASGISVGYFTMCVTDLRQAAKCVINTLSAI